MMSNFREGKLHKLLQRLLKVSYLRLLSSAIYPDKYPAGYQNAELPVTKQAHPGTIQSLIPDSANPHHMWERTITLLFGQSQEENLQAMRVALKDWTTGLPICGLTSPGLTGNLESLVLKA